MSITTLLFDLDGTLLPMEQSDFTKAYFGRLARKLAPLGYDPATLPESIWAGIKAMVQNDGSITNEEAFWQVFCRIHGEKARQDEPVFAAFYREEFQGVQEACGFTPAAREIMDYAHSRGWRVALATNPIFPAVATHSRIRWAGLSPDDFALITTYEDSRTCKPNPAYYREVTDRLGVDPAACVMIGNDVDEDMVAATLGMRVFLLTDCLLNKREQDITPYPHGDFAALRRFLEDLA